MRDVVAVAIILAVLGGTYALGRRALARAHDGTPPRAHRTALALVLALGGVLVLWQVLVRGWEALLG
ncbi:MAG TPA: hypothetical protein VFY17_07800 [Pilimelia sp.]|nr:hypothetical protein [Pilimelia sp.]